MKLDEEIVCVGKETYALVAIQREQARYHKKRLSHCVHTINHCCSDKYLGGTQ